MERKKYVLRMTNREAMLLTIAIRQMSHDKELDRIYKLLCKKYFKRIRKELKDVGNEESN